jgi:hypothetical protein
LLKSTKGPNSGVEHNDLVAKKVEQYIAELLRSVA